MELDLGSAGSITDPTAYFGPWFELGDVHPHRSPRGWAVIGHQAVTDAFRDSDMLSADRITVLERVASQRSEEFQLVVDLLRGWMIFRDPPMHTRLRVPVRSAFTHRRVSGLAGMVESIVDEAIDDMLDHAADGVADLTEHVARPVPALVVGALLGVDRTERPRLQTWSDDLAALVFSTRPSETPPAGVVRAARAFHDFFGRLVDDAQGQDDDSLVARIAALDTSFSRTELIGLCTMLLFAGHETTTSLIQQMAALLLERPDLAEALRAPDIDLERAVDEFLRCYGPARTMVRKVSVAHERSGVTLEAGETVLLSIAAANHDPRVFERPEELDLARDPNPHLGFGWGLHHCLGAQLARLEATTFLRRLLDRFAELRPAGEIPPLVGAVMGFGRGPVRLRVDGGAQTTRRTDRGSGPRVNNPSITSGGSGRA